MLKLFFLCIFLIFTSVSQAMLCSTVFDRSKILNRLTFPNHTFNEGPEGSPLRVKTNDLDIQLENDGALVLSKFGFKVFQNPGEKLKGKELTEYSVAREREGLNTEKSPDYLIGDRVFDHYAPGEGPPTMIVKGVNRKVTRGQTKRVVVNLANNPQYTDGNFRLGQLIYAIQKNHHRDLMEVIVIHGSLVEPKVTTVFPEVYEHSQTSQFK